MTKRILSLALVLIMVLGLVACGQSRPTGPAEAGGTAPALPITLPTEAPETEAAGYVRPAGADSVKTLLEKSMDFIRSDCDYSKIADVHDQLASMAFLLIIMEYESDFATETVTEITWEQAMERAKLLFLDAETLRAKDPALADKVMEWTNAQDPTEFINHVLASIREQFRDGSIDETHPNYEKLSQLLADADKGADYIMTHYPEIFDGARANGAIFGLEDALEKLRSYSDMSGEKEDLAHFKSLELEYRPENSEPGRNGSIYRYYMGSLVDDHSTWGISMLYYVDGETYFLISYDMIVGGTGG